MTKIRSNRIKPLAALILLLSVGLVAHAYQGGIIKSHNHTSAAGDGGQLSNLSVTGTLSATGVVTLSTGTNTLLGSSSLSNFLAYRRPTIVYASTATVSIESGLDGTSGDVTVLFPDNQLRTTNNTTQTTLDLRRVAVLTGTKQSGLFSGTVAANTWYAIYSVKAVDDSTSTVTVATTTLPTQANFQALNSTWTTNGWIYHGLIVYGNNANVTNAIVDFFQSGNVTITTNTMSGNTTLLGIHLSGTAGGTSATYTLARGTGAGQIPSVIGLMYYQAYFNGGSTNNYIKDSLGSRYLSVLSVSSVFANLLWVANDGLQLQTTSSIQLDINLVGWHDNALGVGSNPQL